MRICSLCMDGESNHDCKFFLMEVGRLQPAVCDGCGQEYTPKRPSATSTWQDARITQPIHNDGVRVVLIDCCGVKTHGLASFPRRQQDRTHLNAAGWKLWYHHPNSIALTVTHWMDLEPTESLPEWDES